VLQRFEDLRSGRCNVSTAEKTGRQVRVAASRVKLGSLIARAGVVSFAAATKA
jgi:hypothetical protein